MTRSWRCNGFSLLILRKPQTSQYQIEENRFTIIRQKPSRIHVAYLQSRKQDKNERTSYNSKSVCVKAIYRLPRGTSTTHLYSTNLLLLRHLATVERVAHLHRMVLAYTKHSFHIQLNHEVHKHSTRNLMNIHINKQHPSLRQSINEYNRLSVDVRCIECIKTFKSKVIIKIMAESDEFYVISPLVL